MSDEFSIAAEPELRTVTPGAVIQYFLSPNVSGIADSEVQAQWFEYNDPKTVSGARPIFVRGPSGLEWPDAKWDFPGQHRIVCDVTFRGQTQRLTYHQWVVPVSDVLAQGPQLPRQEEDPAATLDGIKRLIEIIIAVAKADPPKTPEEQQKHEDSLAPMESFRDKLAQRLDSTKNFVRHPIHAEHFDASTQKNFPLRVFLSKVAFKKWLIVDWTNPVVQAATGEYSGVGASDEEAIRNAIADWNDDNRYPDGGITFTIPPLFNVPALKGQFGTDGTAEWDSIAAFFGWVGLGAAVAAGIVTLLAPVPGSQVASALIWTSIFSSTAAAAINIGVRVDEGFSSFRANAFDVLTIVGNLFGVAGLVWSRGATVIVQTERGVLKAALIGQVTTDGVQGVLLGVEAAEDFDKIQNDPKLSPTERTQQLVQLFRRAALNGALLYVSVKASATDLKNLNLRAGSVDATTPAERLKQLEDPSATVDMTQPVKVEGSTTQGDHKTTVHTEQEMQAPHSGGSGKTVRVRSDAERFKDIIGHEFHADLLADVPGLRAKFPELATLTDDEIVALRGYTSNDQKPQFGNARDYERINNALRTSDAAQLSLLDPYIKLLRSGLAKMPQFKGTVTRTLEKVEPDDIRRQFVKGQTWTDLGFMSTSRGKRDHAIAYITMSGTDRGHLIENVSVFDLAEKEVLFPPGVKFEVLDVFEYVPNRFIIMMKQQ